MRHNKSDGSTIDFHLFLGPIQSNMMGLHHIGKALQRLLLTLLFVTNVCTAREQSPLKNVALAFLLVTPSPLPAFSGAVPSKAPLEPLNTLYQILDSMVKVKFCEKHFFSLNSVYHFD